SIPDVKRNVTDQRGSTGSAIPQAMRNCDWSSRSRFGCGVWAGPKRIVGMRHFQLGGQPNPIRRTSRSLDRQHGDECTPTPTSFQGSLFCFRHEISMT
ncbi:hypothetical protein, partial [Rhizobium lentis]|uniref:hypothetical protein n=1 Tax=Rhizobium lentis TaxID=1138194 RepID=UPI001C835CCA